MEKNKLSEKKILVTGGAGFIGSNLCERLLEMNNEVVCLDNFSTGKKKNLLSFLDNKNFTLFDGDIRNLTHCKEAVVGVDYVLHQAALGSVPRSIKDPVATNDVNINGFLNMIIAARDEGVKRFVYAASSSTYGDSTSIPKIEDVIGKPLSPYAITKYVNEMYADVFWRSYGLETIGLRYFNVFGRRQDPDGAYAAVIPKFVRELMDGKSPTINGDGEFTRDFTYIDNVIESNLLALVNDRKQITNRVYNIAFGKSNSLNDLVKYLKKYLSEYDSSIKKIEVNHGPVRDGDIPNSLASIKRAKEELNYNPKYSLQEGLKESVKWYWENYKINKNE